MAEDHKRRQTSGSSDWTRTVFPSANPQWLKITRAIWIAKKIRTTATRTPDPGHALLDQLLEKDDGAASPVPTPEPRYLTYEKKGSGKSGVPASSDPASKSISKPKSRSTVDPKSSENADPESEDHGSDADTSAEGDNDEVLDDMFQAQTHMALSRSRSDQRRHDHAAPHRAGAGGAEDPGSGDDSDGGDWSNGSGGGGGGSPVDQAEMPLPSTMLLRRLFAADHECIPGRQQSRQYNIVDVDPWVIQKINTLTIMTMTLEVLSRALPFRPEWIFSSHVPRVATSKIRSILQPSEHGLEQRPRWSQPDVFEITVDGRLGFLIERYSAVEFQDLIAYWESTHRFPVSPALMHNDPYLALFVVERKNHRSHAGARWKQILQLFLIARREDWCDLDLLLDSYFLHSPKRTDEVAWYPGIEARSANLADPQLHRRESADLIEVLAECDAADPWRTHYRLHRTGLPARRNARLAGRFFNMAALYPNAPPLRPPQ
ncbi:hypothetical protein PHMEG_00022848 [Phytophthora megakarya]|uniref:Uncharacterized protein n=1 Tax=Phytophthora megakarya TaxID=4795 RepID=A0A225VKR8_9STRA|nr:hypothetical protein PHMEG_00022848 [Phytophthora megakarya]